MAQRSGVRGKLFAGLSFAMVLSTYTMYFAYTSPGKVSEYWFMAMAVQERMKTQWKQVLMQVMGSSISGHTRTTEGDSVSGLKHEQDFLVWPQHSTSLPSDLCSERPPTMKGPMSVNTSVVGLAEVERHVLGTAAGEFTPGGHWCPGDCTPRWRVAIVIPFRNRHEHLPILLRHLIPMLQTQRLQFGLYVVEQTGDELFNRAMLFNVGFLEALKDHPWDCMIFHDVDHIPESDWNYYGCNDMPRHYAVKLDKLPYEKFFGGVSGLTVEQIRQTNGFANGFWGWGGEDDDMWNRVHNAGYSVSRPPGDIGRYTSIRQHHHGEVQFLGRFALLRESKERQLIDGLNNLQYFPLVVRRPLYTNITVKLSRDSAPL
ncbi:hypothetical protein ACEWY4_000165 [Coilia grayii]|uniref:Beta-1,4-galactosyltransferase n=1 Tax=Coilia grayii TaxID=363190 RepID=A0ABD1KVV7_9TELE